MNKLNELRNTINTRGKSLLGCAADILETVSKQNLAFANDFAGFAVAQVRLPTQVNDIGDYRSRSKDAISVFGSTLKGHGQELITVLRGVPAQVKDALSVDAPVATPKPAKKTVKKTAAKKASAIKAPAKKAKAA